MTGKTGTASNRRATLAGLAASLLLGLAVPVSAQYDIYDLGQPVRTHDIQADNNNNVHIIWTNRGVLYYGKIVNNAITGKVQVASGVDIVMWRPYMSVQPNGGSVHVAWNTTGFGNMLMHSWKTTGGWTTEHLLTVPKTQKISQATCAIDASGIVHVMFVIWNNVPSDDWATIFYMRKLANGKWEPKQQFIPYNPEYKHPFLIVDSRGQVHATWTLQGRYESDVYEAYYCSAPSGGKLSYTDMVKLPKRADSDVNGYGELYVDHNGVVHRTICGWSNAKQKICLDHTKKVGRNFETPTRPSLDFLNVATDPMPVVVANEDGIAIVAWGEIGSNGSNKVKASFYDPDKRSWSLHTFDAAAGIPTGHYIYRVAMTRTDKQMFCLWRGSNGNMKLLVSPLDGTPPPDDPPPPPPEGAPVAIIIASPTSGPSPLTVTFDATSSYDPDGNIVSYSWDFGEVKKSGAVVSHTYTSAGTYRAHLIVTDNDGYTDGASEIIEVGQSTQPPIADFKFSPSSGGIFPCEITFDGGASRDPDGKIIKYTWNFGDGGRGSGRLAKHTYTSWGTFAVSLIVWDNSGASARKVRPIEIRRLFQPLNIRWETHSDESLFQTRYVNAVSWERNPANDSLGIQIVLHRIWRKKPGESDLAFRLIAELTAEVFSYTDKDTGANNTYVYTVTVRDAQGHESPILDGQGAVGLIQSGKDVRSFLGRDKLGHK